jgi:hypothetical protein
LDYYESSRVNKLVSDEYNDNIGTASIRGHLVQATQMNSLQLKSPDGNDGYKQSHLELAAI